MSDRETFDQILTETLQLDFSGWDFSSITGRWQEQAPRWDYREIVSQHIVQANALLDMGTGGGEFLASLPSLPAHTRATENYAPNLPVARQRLAPLGVVVQPFEHDNQLPFADHEFDLIINRHESYAVQEVKRILRPGGIFLTQQVGGRDNLRLNEVLQAPVPGEYEDWLLADAVAALEAAGFTILDALEDFPPTYFYDIGAVIFYLQAIPWQIPNFSVDSYRERLFALHQFIQEEGAFVTTSHRFLIKAHR